MIERVDCDQDGEEYETPHGSYVRFSDHQRVMAEAIECCTIQNDRNLWLEIRLNGAKELMRQMLVEMDALAGYGDEETDGAVYLVVHEWEERVRAFFEKVPPGC